MGDSACWCGFSIKVHGMWSSDYDCEKNSRKEYERIKEEGNLSEVVFFIVGY